MYDAPAAPQEPTLVKKDGRVVRHLWDLPLDPDFLERFLTDVFGTYWDRIVFGPLVEGASYEMQCPCAPTRTDLSNGYLTIWFGGTHFHLCIGDVHSADPARPTTEEWRRERKPAVARLFRMIDSDGAPSSWGFEMRNGRDDSQLAIFFENPFLSRDDGIEDEPHWERLAMWRDISARYLGRPPEAYDESGKGFVGFGKG
jgi:hypothetical protein